MTYNPQSKGHHHHVAIIESAGTSNPLYLHDNVQVNKTGAGAVNVNTTTEVT